MRLSWLVLVVACVVLGCIYLAASTTNRKDNTEHFSWDWDLDPTTIQNNLTFTINEDVVNVSRPLSEPTWIKKNDIEAFEKTNRLNYYNSILPCKSGNQYGYRHPSSPSSTCRVKDDDNNSSKIAEDYDILAIPDNYKWTKYNDDITNVYKDNGKMLCMAGATGTGNETSYMDENSRYGGIVNANNQCVTPFGNSVLVSLRNDFEVLKPSTAPDNDNEENLSKRNIVVYANHPVSCRYYTSDGGGKTDQFESAVDCSSNIAWYNKKLTNEFVENTSVLQSIINPIPNPPETRTAVKACMAQCESNVDCKSIEYSISNDKNECKLYSQKIETDNIDQTNSDGSVHRFLYNRTSTPPTPVTLQRIQSLFPLYSSFNNSVILIKIEYTNTSNDTTYFIMSKDSISHCGINNGQLLFIRKIYTSHHINNTGDQWVNLPIGEVKTDEDLIDDLHTFDEKHVVFITNVAYYSLISNSKYQFITKNDQTFYATVTASYENQHTLEFNYFVFSLKFTPPTLVVARSNIPLPLQYGGSSFSNAQIAYMNFGNNVVVYVVLVQKNGMMYMLRLRDKGYMEVLQANDCIKNISVNEPTVLPTSRGSFNNPIVDNVYLQSAVDKYYITNIEDSDVCDNTTRHLSLENGTNVIKVQFYKVESNLTNMNYPYVYVIKIMNDNKEYLKVTRNTAGVPTKLSFENPVNTTFPETANEFMFRTNVNLELETNRTSFYLVNQTTADNMVFIGTKGGKTAFYANENSAQVMLRRALGGLTLDNGITNLTGERAAQAQVISEGNTKQWNLTSIFSNINISNFGTSYVSLYVYAESNGNKQILNVDGDSLTLVKWPSISYTPITFHYLSSISSESENRHAYVLSYLIVSPGEVALPKMLDHTTFKFTTVRPSPNSNNVDIPPNHIIYCDTKLHEAFQPTDTNKFVSATLENLKRDTNGILNTCGTITSWSFMSTPPPNPGFSWAQQSVPYYRY